MIYYKNKMKNKNLTSNLVKYFLLLIFSFSTLSISGCSLRIEHEFAKICCGKYLGKTITADYEIKFATKTEQIKLADGILFAGLAVTDSGKTYEYEMHGDYIEFWNVSLVNGALFRNGTTHNEHRRKWYFFGFEPSTYLPISIVRAVFDFGFEPSPDFELISDVNGNFKSPKESRLASCIYRRIGYAEPIIDCGKKPNHTGIFMQKVI
jgi:hypothetical protein